MGAWGVGHFENDDAADWVWELEDKRSLQPAVDAISAVPSSGYLEAPDASMALAAAEVIAAVAGKPAQNLPDSVSNVVSGLGKFVPEELKRRTRAAVERILAESELRELWEESEHFDQWRSNVQDLLSRLG
ncbi:MAG: DUF4259 domain-containing protein [Pseudomonadota bacterium]